MAIAAISVKSNIDQIARELRTDSQKQIRFATMLALNDTSKDCRLSVQEEMRRVFRSPVRRTLSGVKYGRANRESLSIQVWIEDFPDKGIAPAAYLAPEIEGGARHKKRFERALQLRGLMPSGMYAVPADNAPRNANGDVPGSFYVRILSYLNAFGEQGYRANMTDKRRTQIAGVKLSENGYKKITGAMYFVALGRGKTKHLAPGIYKKSGTHGAVIEPVFLYVDAVTYKERLDFAGVVTKTAAANFDGHMRARLARALATAR